MSQTSRLALLAGAAVATFAGPAWAAEGQAWSNQNDEVRALVAEAMADAETRTSLLQSGGTAGYDNKFFIGSADGNFRLNVGGLVQFRYYLNFRDDDGDNDNDDDFESGFSTIRTKVSFGGHVHDPNLFYFVRGIFDNDGGSFDLEDAYVGYRWDNGFQLRWGQFVAPLLRERLVQDQYQLAADRGVVNSVFSQNYTQGVELGYTGETFQAMFSFNDGLNTENGDFATDRTINQFSYLDGGESDYAFTGRVEIKFAGNWDQFKDFTSPSGSEFAAMLGFAGHIEGGDSSSSNFSDGDYLYASYTADVSIEGDGWNFFVAGVGSHGDFEDVIATGTDVEYDDFGVTAQGGIVIPDTDLEPFIRYDVLFPDDDERDVSDDNDTFSVLTFGVNYYLYGHAAKFTADVQWFIDDVATIIDGDQSIGWLGDDDEGEFTVRFQFQLMF